MPLQLPALVLEPWVSGLAPAVDGNASPVGPERLAVSFLVDWPEICNFGSQFLMLRKKASEVRRLYFATSATIGLFNTKSAPTWRAAALASRSAVTARVKAPLLPFSSREVLSRK